MKRYEKLYLLLVFILLASFFTGCGKEEKELVNAFIKNQDILSLESTSHIGFTLNVEGLDDEAQVIFNEIANQINDMKLSMNQKSITNEDQTIAKAQIDANVQLKDMIFDSSIWLDMDMSGDKLVLKEIFKLPSMLMSSIPGAAGKEYITLDFDTINESSANMEEEIGQPIDFDEVMAIAMKYQEKFKDAFVGYIKKYDSNLSLVTKLDDKIVDGENIKYYQVQFDNDSFRDFLKYTTISLLQDKNIIPLFEEYMTEIANVSGEEIPKELLITKKLDKIVQKTEDFFEKLQALTILGNDGILITYGINEDGYFLSEEGKLDFVIDTEAMASLLAGSTEENQFLQAMVTPVFNLSISYETKVNGINQDLHITMPHTTKENAIDYVELMEGLVPDIEPISQGQPELMVIVEGEYVEFTNEPILVNNHYLFSTRDMAKALGASVNWNGETKEITIVKDEKQSTLKEAVIRDDVSYIPLRVVAKDLGYTLEWDQEFQMIFIEK